jgi:hypothetical protein
MIYYTYAYLREDRTPYYIGKGQGGRLYKKRKGEIKPPKDKSRVIFLKQNLTEEEAFRHEVYMIAVFGRKDLGTGILRNRTDGGEGPSGAVRSDETKRKIKEKRKYQIITKEQSNKVREKLKGKKRPDWVIEKIKEGITEDHKRKMSEARKGINRPNLWKSFKIINPDGILIEGSNISGFCKENNLYPDCFNKVLNGTQSHHKGWTKPRNDLKPYQVKKYILNSPNGVIIEIVGITNFCRKNNLSYSNIAKVLNGTQRHHKGWTKPVEEINK